MFKRLLVISSLSIPLGVSAAEVKNLYHAPLSSLGQFKLEKQFKNKRAVNAASPSIDELKIITESIEKRILSVDISNTTKACRLLAGKPSLLAAIPPQFAWVSKHR